MTAIGPKPCTHRTPIHHHAGKLNGRTLWVCSTCAYQGLWDRQWSPFTAFPCPYCRELVIERVLCPKCAILSRHLRRAHGK
jgi:hypothetical protein